jgi:hypothetical protein
MYGSIDVSDTYTYKIHALNLGGLVPQLQRVRD